MSKPKKSLPLLRSELHVVLPMSPEEAHWRLTNSVDAFQRITTLPQDDDTIAFRLEYWRDKEKRTAIASGRLRRWQGTDTRLDCDGATTAPGIWAEWAAVLALSGAITGIFGVLLATHLHNAWIIYDWNVFNRTYVLPLMALVTGISFWLSRTFFLKNLFEARRYAAAKDLDKLLSHVVATLTVEGIVPNEIPRDELSDLAWIAYRDHTRWQQR